MVERNNLGALLRSWRERTSPTAKGFTVDSRRRAVGLRREELAELAGVSADYLKQLEQGRGRPSAAVIGALARALDLDRTEYEYLCVLAGHAASGSGGVPHEVGPAARRLLDRFADTPVCVFDAAWTTIAWNPAWQALLQCGPDPGYGRDRNVAWRLFAGVPNPMFRSPARADRFEATVVADLKNARRRYPSDAFLASFVSELLTRSPRFRERWESAQAAPRDDDRVTVVHHDAGPITLDADVLTIHAGDLRLVVFSAEPGSPDAARLALARALDSQNVE